MKFIYPTTSSYKEPRTRVLILFIQKSQADHTPSYVRMCGINLNVFNWLSKHGGMCRGHHLPKTTTSMQFVLLQAHMLHLEA